jgi:hypothetical protein
MWELTQADRELILLLIDFAIEESDLWAGWGESSPDRLLELRDKLKSEGSDYA